MSAFNTRLRAMREQVREGWCMRPALNVGDVQVVPRLANTLGRLRIMMPYCIQIRIPTVRCMGIDTEIALSRGNAPPVLRETGLRASVLLQGQGNCRIR